MMIKTTMTMIDIMLKMTMKMIVVSERQDPRSDQELICCDPSATSRTDNFIHYSMILFTMMTMMTMMTMTMMQEDVLVVARK